MAGFIGMIAFGVVVFCCVLLFQAGLQSAAVGNSSPLSGNTSNQSIFNGTSNQTMSDGNITAMLKIGH